MKEPAHAVKGIIGADEPPLEARVSRLDECRLKQKVGYGQHADPINPHSSIFKLFAEQPNILHKIHVGSKPQ